MGTHGWRPDRSVKDQLYDSGFRFGFYQAVRILEKIHPERIPVGEGSDPRQEPVRFSATVSQAFPASEIHEILPDTPPRRTPEMKVNFMGLAGCLGPLPAPYTDLILERIRQNDTALRDFLDIFNHRLISILYRVRKIYRPGFDWSHPSTNRFTRYLLSLIGLGTPGLRNRMAVSDRAMLYYTALLSQQPRSMSGLATLLTDYFNTPVKGVQLTGQWLRLDSDQLTRIGPSGQNRVLGRNALLAFRVWDQQAGFEVHFVSLTYENFLEFLPPGTAYRPLCQIIRFYAPRSLDFALLLTVKAPTIPRSHLGVEQGPRLGWTSWIRAGEKLREEGRIRLVPRLLEQLKRDFKFDYERKRP